jgi:mRNA interferase RelE/StbE
MMWKIKIHHLVVEEDLKKIPRSDQSIILKTIFKKLSREPEKYGEPLRHVLKGYWKLKISHYRVVYRIEKNIVQVFVLKIGLRRDEEVYREMAHRLNKI